MNFWAISPCQRKTNKGNMYMRNIKLSTSMGIALTLLLAGIAVQVTDFLELFGHNSVIPLIIGLSMVFVGVAFFLLRRWRINKKH